MSDDDDLINSEEMIDEILKELEVFYMQLLENGCDHAMIIGIMFGFVTAAMHRYIGKQGAIIMLNSEIAKMSEKKLH